MAKWKKVPKWWLEIEQKLIEGERKLEEICGAEPGYFTSLRKRREDETVKFWIKNALKIMNEEDVKRVSTIVDYLRSLAKYRWTRFKFENLDNSFGIAENLFYDEKSKRIYIRKPIKKIIEEGLNQLARKIKKVLT